jgi:hypothetical protein
LSQLAHCCCWVLNCYNWLTAAAAAAAAAGWYIVTTGHSNNTFDLPRMARLKGLLAPITMCSSFHAAREQEHHTICTIRNHARRSCSPCFAFPVTIAWYQPDVTLFRAERRPRRGGPRDAPQPPAQGTVKFNEELIEALQPLTEDVGFGSQKCVCCDVLCCHVM